MKITFEFASIKDMLFQMPKIAQLVSGDAPAEERMAAALAEDPEPLVMKITPKDGIPFTEEEKEAIQATINAYVDKARIEKVEKLREELAPETGPFGVPEEPPKKNPPKAKEAEKPEADKAPAATETSARKTLNDLVKAKGNAAVKLIFHELGVKNFGDLKEDQYATAIERAEKVSAMGDDEYEAALKEAGIKGGRK